MHVWSVGGSPEVLEKLQASLTHLPATHFAILRRPGVQRQVLQFFSLTQRQAAALQKAHGGKVEKVPESWQTSPPRAPIRIRDRFLIVESAGNPPDPRELIIPSGMAFGTGDHPTTASCLRLLCDLAEAFSEKKWSLLDAGTGSGLLAIAARKLGAKSVHAFDYDAHSIRTARENARINSARGIRWSRKDLQTFQARGEYDVVTANIFSELFLGTWQRICPAIVPGGFFILSGILRFQADECRAALMQRRFEVQREVRLGKWVTFLAHAPGKVVVKPISPS